MDGYDIDLDPSLFTGELADGLFLTRVKHNMKKNIYEITYHMFKKGKDINSFSIKVNNGYIGYQIMMSDKYKSLLKLIQINDSELYDKISKTSIKLRNNRIKYNFYSAMSKISAIGAITFGFSLANYNDDAKALLPVILSSVCLIMTGVYSKKCELEGFYTYKQDYINVINEIETKSKDYIRNKKLGENV